jgi:hypothetical protein
MTTINMEGVREIAADELTTEDLDLVSGGGKGTVGLPPGSGAAIGATIGLVTGGPPGAAVGAVVGAAAETVWNAVKTLF